METRNCLSQKVCTFFLLILFLFGPPSTCYLYAQSNNTPANFTVAFIGDQGIGSDAVAVLNLILTEGAQAVVHSGDFDYGDNPQAWENQINSVLGANYPYFASIGNHDTGQYYGSNGYQSFLEARMIRLGIPWDGDLGVQSSHEYMGIFFVLTGPGTQGSGHANYIRDQLASNQAIWSISSWHRNMRAMQVGAKTDDTGWGVYEESRKGGAILATGHEHSYSRTYLLSSFENQTIASLSDILVLAKDLTETAEDEGRSFAFVSGLGGQSIRNQVLSGNWWASIYTSDQNANFGALFGVFNYDGNPNLAKFYFMDINGIIADEFFVVSGGLIANFSATPRSGDAPLSVTFDEQSSGNPDSYYWDFGDGSSGTDQNPSHIYNNSGTYTVSLTITGSDGDHTETKSGFITVSDPADPPIAGFTGAPVSGNAPLIVSFNHESSGSITGYSWEFGDGSSSTSQNPSHTYSTAGNYTVSLTVAGPGGNNTETKTDYIQVSTPPPSGTITLRNGLDGYDGAKDTWLSDGSSTNYGNSPTLETDGSPDKSVLLFWDISGIPPGSVVEEAQITLDIFDVSNQTYEFYELLRFWQDNEANWSQAESGQSWQTGGANGSQDRGSTVLGSVLGQSSGLVTINLNANGIEVVQSWVDNPGSNFGLILLDYTGATNGLDFYSSETSSPADRPTLEIIYTAGGPPPPPPPPPTADFTASPTNGTAPLSVFFSSQSSGSITSYSWDFGDNGSSTAQNPSHNYTAAGNYTISLTVTGPGGNDTDTKTDYVIVTELPAGGSWEVLTFDDFEGGWGNFSDGGSDCQRSSSDAAYAHQGTYCVRIRDNSGTSSSFYYSNGIDVTGYNEIRISFWYYPRSMDNSNEDFWVQYYDGNSWHTVATYARNSNFQNNNFYEISDLYISRSNFNFPSNMRVRFMCDASSNSDYVYIDEIEIAARTGSGGDPPPPPPPANNAPEFASNQIDAAIATVGLEYNGTISDQASDPDGDPITFSKSSGPGWLNVASDGTLSGTPGGGDTGDNSFIIRVTDIHDDYDEATLEMTVNAGGGSGSWEVLTYDDFESGWGSFADGGSDCRRSSNDASYAHQGNYCVRLRDNSSSSSFSYDGSVDVTGYDEIRISFWYYPRSMDNSNEDFWVQYYDGSSWQTVATYARNSDFQNNNFYEVDNIVISRSSYAFPNDMRIRFVCDASNNSDYVYIDEVEVAARANSGSPLAKLSTGFEATRVATPADYELEQNYPNPFNPETRIKFDIPENSNISLMVYSIRGQLIRTLVSGIEYIAGTHTIEWDGRNNSGELVPSGIYLIRLRAGGFLGVRKALLMK